MNWLDAIILGSAVFALDALVRPQLLLWRAARRARAPHPQDCARPRMQLAREPPPPINTLLERPASSTQERDG